MTHGARSALRNALLALVPDGRIVAEVNELATVRELTARGLGVSLMPRSVVASHGDRLSSRPLSPRRTLPFSLVWRVSEHPTPAARAFREHVLRSGQQLGEGEATRQPNGRPASVPRRG